MSQTTVLIASPLAEVGAEDSHPKTPSPERKPLSVRAIWLGVASLVIVTWLVGRSGLYTPGSDPGYFLGLAGGLMMLSLLLYPLRKYVRILRTFGDIRRWFRVHMVLGIAGPVLVLLHSTFHTASFNAAMALYAMVIVAGSGIVGRFMYAKIHRGLYGRRSTLDDLQMLLGVQEGEVKSRFRHAPLVETHLRAFTAYALESPANLWHKAWHLATLRIRTWRVRLDCRRAIAGSLAGYATRHGWSPRKLARRRRAALLQVRAYLDIVVDVRQFHTYERLFSLWHVLHVPLVWGLVFTGIVHVIAVHMY